jgi:hypothetical protein
LPAHPLAGKSVDINRNRLDKIRFIFFITEVISQFGPIELNGFAAEALPLFIILAVGGRNVALSQFENETDIPELILKN